MRLGEKFGTHQANVPIIKEVLNEHLLMRPKIDSEVSEKRIFINITIIL
jgi:hypothetical protein